MDVADAIAEDKSIFMDKGVVGSDIEMSVFAYSHVPQATAAITVVYQENFDVAEKIYETFGYVGSELSNSVPNEAMRKASPARVSVVPSPAVEDSDHTALRSLIQELQAQKEYVLARRAGNQKTRVDTLLMLCF